VSYPSLLRGLEDADLDEVLRRRPEAAGLSNHPRPGFEALASLLSTPHDVQAALVRVDRFLRQLLELGALQGGLLTEPIASVEGVPAGGLERGADELARWGLAFPSAEGLVVPRPVLDAIHDPGGLGPPVRGLLQGLTVSELVQIARTLRPGEAVPSRKAELIDHAAACFEDGEAIRALVAAAPPIAAAMIEQVRRAGGTVGRYRAYEGLASDLRQQAYEARHSRGRQARDGEPWLRARALLISSGWEDQLALPAEVEHALRRQVFRHWQEGPPEPALEPLIGARSPLETVEEMTVVLDYVRRNRPALLQTGELGTRERRRIAAATRVSEAHVAFLVALGHHAGLLVAEPVPGRRRAGAPRRYRLAPTMVLRRWVAEPCASAWLRLVHAWRRSLDGDRRAEAVIAELLTLPEGMAAELAGFARRLHWRAPSAFPDLVATAGYASQVAGTLSCLGVGAGEEAIGLDAVGRAAVSGADAEVVAGLLPPTVDECTVESDLRITVAGLPSSELGRGLAAMADLETAYPARVYRVGEASLRRAMDEGFGSDQILALLRRHAGTGVPAVIERMIEDVGRRHGRLRVGFASVFLQADQESLIAEVLATPRLRGLQLRRIAPNVAVLTGRTPDQVLEALRRAGFMPTADAEAAEAGEDTNLLPVDPGLYDAGPPATPPGLEPAVVDRLVATLRGAPVELEPPEGVPAGTVVKGPRELGALIQSAVEEAGEIEVEYMVGQRAMRWLLEPVTFDGMNVVAWSPQSPRRVFLLSDVRWARRTGRGFEPKWDEIMGGQEAAGEAPVAEVLPLFPHQAP
jgi:hypothetical protein